ncbi:hypothetical protein GCM10028772_38560 [Nocardioides ultimimeridianus]
MVLLAPFSLVRRLLGDTASPGDPVAASPDARATARAARVGRAITGAAAHTPWRSDCYPQALAARIALRALRVPHTVTFGVRRDDAGELRAHAWVTCGDLTVTGGSAEAWTGVASFAWAP